LLITVPSFVGYQIENTDTNATLQLRMQKNATGNNCKAFRVPTTGVLRGESCHKHFWIDSTIPLIRPQPRIRQRSLEARDEDAPTEVHSYRGMPQQFINLRKNEAAIASAGEE
jgi:hypothetical protein